MLFRRRKPEDFLSRLRLVVWPRRSFWRSAQYFAKRVLRLTATPHSIAAGVASGVFVSFTPFLGFHILMGAAIAWLIRGNVIASAIGATVVGNPVTLPIMWGAALEIGRSILSGSHPGGIAPVDIGDVLAHFDLSQLWGPIVMPLAVGSLPLGLSIALVFYGLTRWAVVGFRAARRRRLAERARRRAAGHYDPDAGDRIIA